MQSKHLTTTMNSDILTLISNRDKLRSAAETLLARAFALDKKIHRLKGGAVGSSCRNYQRVFNEKGRVPSLWARGGSYFVRIRIGNMRRRLRLENASSIETAIIEREKLITKIRSGDYITQRANYEPRKEEASNRFLNDMVAVEAIRGLKPQQT
jgi:hypothetical protein